MPCELIAQHAGALYHCSPAGKYVRVRTPYLYPDGDVLDLYWRDDASALSDMGETLRWLDGQTTTQRRTKRHMQLIQEVCGNHGIEFFRGTLTTRVAEPEMMASTITRLAQACIRVSDLWFTFRTRIFESFPDEVEEYLQERSIRFDRNEALIGASGKTWRVDFHTRTRQRSALVLTLNTGTSGATRRLTDHAVAAWVDLGSLRMQPDAPKFISLFDDTIDVWSAEDFKQVEAMSDVYRWSRPDEFEGALLAA